MQPLGFILCPYTVKSDECRKRERERERYSGTPYSQRDLVMMITKLNRRFVEKADSCQ